MEIGKKWRKIVNFPIVSIESVSAPELKIKQPCGCKSAA